MDTKNTNDFKALMNFSVFRKFSSVFLVSFFINISAQIFIGEGAKINVSGGTIIYTAEKMPVGELVNSAMLISDEGTIVVELDENSFKIAEVGLQRSQKKSSDRLAEKLRKKKNQIVKTYKSAPKSVEKVEPAVISLEKNHDLAFMPSHKKLFAGISQIINYKLQFAESQTYLRILRIFATKDYISESLTPILSVKHLVSFSDRAPPTLQ